MVGVKTKMLQELTPTVKSSKPKIQDKKSYFYNETTLKKAPTVPYYWSHTTQTWKPTKNLYFVSMTYDSGDNVNSYGVAKQEVQRWVDIGTQQGEKYFNSQSWGTGFSSRTVKSYSFNFLLIENSQGNVQPDIIPLGFMERWDNSQGSQDKFVMTFGTEDIHISVNSQGKVNADTRLHNIYNIIDPADDASVSQPTPMLMHLYKQTATQQNIPSLAWWLYQQNPSDIKSDVLKGMVQDAKSKYGYWGQQYFGKSSGLNESQFRQILTDELNEKKTARLTDLARASFLPWYEGTWLPAVASGDQDAVNDAAETTLDPAVQDADATLNTAESAEDYEEKYGRKNYPLYILGGVGALTAIYIGYLVYKRNSGVRDV